MTVRSLLLAPVVLVPLLIVAGVGGLMLAATLLIDEPDPRTRELYTLASDGAPIDTFALTEPPELEWHDDEGEDEGERTSGHDLVEGGASEEDARLNEDAVVLAHPARMRIERLAVDAGLVILGIDSSTGNMAAPDGPDLVGWYDFTGRPGSGGGNAVFAAHRDWAGHGPAVFSDLERLEVGDPIDVELTEGSLIRYRVVAAESYPVEDLDMREILAQTDQESITLITCAGDFLDQDYTERHIVRAVRSEVILATAASR